MTQPQPRPTWEERDLPVLRAIVDLVEATGHDVVAPFDIEQQTGFDSRTVQRALGALSGAQPPFFSKTFVQGNRGDLHAVYAVTERARRAVGLWPTAEDLADRFIAAYDTAIAQATTEEQRGPLRRIRSLVSDTGRGVLVEVMARILAGS